MIGAIAKKVSALSVTERCWGIYVAYMINPDNTMALENVGNSSIVKASYVAATALLVYGVNTIYFLNGADVLLSPQGLNITAG